METSAILAPAAVLVLWSLMVLAWLTTIRLKSLAAAGIRLANVEVGARYSDIESTMPAKANWASHNYTHLMEQPTIFYAVIAVLAIAGDTSGVNLAFAWIYVGLRIAHSLWQCGVNVVRIRVVLFASSTFCLWVLAINAVRLTLLG